MERVQVAENLSFSRIIHGLWRLAEWDMNIDEIVSLIEKCMEQGITTFDHADIYGNYACEGLFGNALKQKPSLRESIQIVTKCGIKLLSSKFPENKVQHYDTSKEHIIRSAEQSLIHLNTEYIDVLLIHRPDPFMDPSETAEAFQKLKQEGKVRHFGVSNFTPSQYTMLSSYLDFPLITNQVEISALHLNAFKDGTIEQCLEKRIAPMAWSPLAGGLIFSSDEEKAVRVRSAFKEVGEELGVHALDQLMYAWILSHPARIMPIAGSGNMDRIQQAVDALDVPMTRQQWFKIWIASQGHGVA